MFHLMLSMFHFLCHGYLLGSFEFVHMFDFCASPIVDSIHKAYTKIFGETLTTFSLSYLSIMGNNVTLRVITCYYRMWQQLMTRNLMRFLSPSLFPWLATTTSWERWQNCRQRRPKISRWWQKIFCPNVRIASLPDILHSHSLSWTENFLWLERRYFCMIVKMIFVL